MIRVCVCVLCLSWWKPVQRCACVHLFVCPCLCVCVGSRVPLVSTPRCRLDHPVQPAVWALAWRPCRGDQLAVGTTGETNTHTLIHTHTHQHAHMHTRRQSERHCAQTNTRQRRQLKARARPRELQPVYMGPVSICVYLCMSQVALPCGPYQAKVGPLSACVEVAQREAGPGCCY